MSNTAVNESTEQNNQVDGVITGQTTEIIATQSSVVVHSITPGQQTVLLNKETEYQIETNPPGNYNQVNVVVDGATIVTPYNINTGRIRVRFDTLSTATDNYKTITANIKNSNNPAIVVRTLVVQIQLRLNDGNSENIDPTGSNESRNRMLRLVSTPAIQNINISSISKERLATPSYGHNHNFDNNQIAVRGGTSVDSGTTNSNGYFEFRYRGPIMSGEVNVTVNYNFSGQTQNHQLTQRFYNRVDGLVQLTGGSGITLCGETATHPDNHWGTQSAITRITQLASNYRQQFNENLCVNDMSLQYGGLFDINGNASPPHQTHRDGTNADVYPTVPTQAKWNYIMTQITELGGGYYDESNTGSPHVHLRDL